MGRLPGTAGRCRAMVVSWRDVAKLALFVLLVAAAAFYVVSNRQHLMDGLVVSRPVDTGTSGPGDTGTSGPVDGRTIRADGTGDGSAAPDGSSGTGLGESTGEIISVGVSETGAPAAGADGSSGQGDAFDEFRLEREQARSEQLDLLREVVNNPNLGEAARAQAVSLWLEITQEVAAEVDLENLIRAKGFADAVVVLQKGKAVVMVKAASLSKEDVLRVADLVVRVAGLEFEDITVMARGG